jgi:hypothetical protein
LFSFWPSADVLRDPFLDALATINCVQEFQRCQQSLNRIIEVAVHVSPHSEKLPAQMVSDHAGEVEKRVRLHASP